jgi:hypothetical protein
VDAVRGDGAHAFGDRAWGPGNLTQSRIPSQVSEGTRVGSVIKKRRKRMAKKKHRKLLKKTRIQRRNKKK